MDIKGLGYVGIGTNKIEEWKKLGRILGLKLNPDSTENNVLMQLDEKYFRLSLEMEKEEKIAYLGFEIANDLELEEVYKELNDNGISAAWGSSKQCEKRKVRKIVECIDPAGIKLEFFTSQEMICVPFQPSQPISGFVTGSLGMGHAVIGVPDLKESLNFYTKVLGFRISDYWMDRLVFLHCNQRHHSIALAQSSNHKLNLHHLMFQVQTIDDVGIIYDACENEGIPINATLGRHSNDLMYSFYLETPSGFQIEYGCHGILIDDRTWSVKTIDRPSIWGHRRQTFYKK